MDTYIVVSRIKNLVLQLPEWVDTQLVCRYNQVGQFIYGELKESLRSKRMKHDGNHVDRTGGNQIGIRERLSGE